MKNSGRTTFPALAVGVLLGITACSAQPVPDGGDQVLRVAAVDNPDVKRLAELADHFVADHPGWRIEFEFLPEGELRQKVTTEVATGAGQFGAAQGTSVTLEGTGRYDLVTVGAYEATLWSERDWLRPLDDAIVEPDDIIPTVWDVVAREGSIYAAPLYGESSFTMYRTDLFEGAGLEMPEQPTWDFVLEAAETLHDPEGGVYGMCQRGKPGWGENVALVTAMANSYGGRWFDMEWTPELTSQAWDSALRMYIELGALADPGSREFGFNENTELFRNGQCAIWVDSTAAGSALVADGSQVADVVGFAQAPGTGLSKDSAWLWVWSLAVPANSTHADLAKEFAGWASSPEYLELAAAEYGWDSVPPGIRESLYSNPEYIASAPFAELTLASITAADPLNPTVEPVPYSGIQYVTIPEFQSLGNAAGNQIASALSGNLSVAEALDRSQWVTEQLNDQIRFMQEDDR